MKRYTFKKEERLCAKRSIDDLFTNGSSFVLYPFRIVYRRRPLAGSPVQMLVSVPKRRFPRAVDRNLLKRRIRECYRLHKEAYLYPEAPQAEEQLLLAIQYIGKEVLDYAAICNRLTQALAKLK